MTRKLMAVVLGLGLSMMVGLTALAWPDLPPDKVLLSGPGVKGQIEIEDEATLDALRLGGIEDFEWGAIPPQKMLAEKGYRIERFFEGGEFQMGDLVYYPASANWRSVVYFEDGPMKNGDRSPHHKHWYFTTWEGDAALKKYLAGIGVSLADVKTDAVLAAQVIEPPVAIRAGVPVELRYRMQVDDKITKVTFQREGTSEKLVMAGSASGAAGEYLVQMTFPLAGMWNWSVQPFKSSPETAFAPLNVVEGEQDAAGTGNSSKASSEERAVAADNAPNKDAQADTSVSAQDAPGQPSSDQAIATQTSETNEAMPWGLAILAGLVGVLGLVVMVGMRRGR